MRGTPIIVLMSGQLFLAGLFGTPVAAQEGDGPVGPPAAPPGYEDARRGPEPTSDTPAPPPRTYPSRSATAPPAPGEVPPTPEEIADRRGQRHTGFYLRIMPGGAFLQAAENESLDELRLRGPAFSFDLSVGFALTEDFVLYGNLYVLTAIATSAQARGPGGESLEDAAFSIAGVGLGVAHYVMPANVSLGGSIAMLTMAIASDTTVTETDFGAGVSLVASKEWWLGRRWAFGVGLKATVGWIPSPGRVLYTVVGTGLHASVTFD